MCWLFQIYSWHLMELLEILFISFPQLASCFLLLSLDVLTGRVSCKSYQKIVEIYRKIYIQKYAEWHSVSHALVHLVLDWR
jgi:hypothetical protein